MQKILALWVLVSASILACGQANSTPIPENVKEHHKTLYSSYFDPNLKLKNIDDETAAGREVKVTVGLDVDTGMDPEAVAESREHPYPDMSLRGISCQADAVVIAAPQAAEASLTADKRGLFTDVRFSIESVLKNTTTKQLEDSSIIVTRPGGETIIHGRRVQVTVNGFPQFALGHRYLLFLGHLSASDAFEAFSVGTFELTDGGVVPFRTGLSAIASLKNESTFLTEVRAAITAPCTHQSFPSLGKHQEGL